MTFVSQFLSGPKWMVVTFADILWHSCLSIWIFTTPHWSWSPPAPGVSSAAKSVLITRGSLVLMSRSPGVSFVTILMTWTITGDSIYLRLTTAHFMKRSVPTQFKVSGLLDAWLTLCNDVQPHY